ncbi:PWWP domain protein [Paragonimus heterotremus]|uniref:PWWP domain protein n=1 Tax=Paragonimus heterotremus TaxID=100268 RepID=A0A8J4T0N2_9TREM|nr:PWWP domain protein [Paragonimus heterotremus]
MCHRPGDRVFAKIKGYSNWPARINPLPPDVHIPKGRLPVFFYGTYEVSFVPIKNIVPYEKFKNKWGKAKSNPQFMTAMKEIESDPWMFMLGEDPRAEAFLLQFYNFKPSDSVPSTGFIQLSGHPKSTVSPTPDSPRSLSSLRRALTERTPRATRYRPVIERSSSGSPLDELV